MPAQCYKVHLAAPEQSKHRTHAMTLDHPTDLQLFYLHPSDLQDCIIL